MKFIVAFIQPNHSKIAASDLIEANACFIKLLDIFFILNKTNSFYILSNHFSTLKNV